ncbi:MAG: hypothetical protein J5873_04280 [Bacteroidales bacterium]|nr:hypothetical protein [Bacteroidales bacterium]
MRKTFGILMIAAAVLTFASTLFSCRKDSDCKAVITARYLRDGRAAEPAAGCSITIGESDYSDSVRFVGVTDAEGRLEHTWRNEAKLKVVAEIDGHSGMAMLQLVKGETVEQEVLIPVN